MPPYAGRFEPLLGAVNSVNTAFTTPTRYLLGSTACFLNGVLLQIEDDDGWFETDADTGTITFKQAPITGDIVQAFYLDRGDFIVPPPPYLNARDCVDFGIVVKSCVDVGIVVQGSAQVGVHALACVDLRTNTAQGVWVVDSSRATVSFHGTAAGCVAVDISVDGSVKVTTGSATCVGIRGNSRAPADVVVDTSVCTGVRTRAH